MAVTGVQTVFHLLVFLVFLYSSYYEWFHVEIVTGPFGKLYFLTYWNACLQTVYYALCFASDINSDQRSNSRLKRWRDHMHASVAFPLGTFVVTSFWTLMAIDRELVFPKANAHLVPDWLNHSLHTAVFPFLMIEKYLVHHQYPSRRSGIALSCTVAVVYIIWILFVAYYEGFWVYPVLEVLAMLEKVLFIAVCCVFCASFYILGEFLTNILWGKPVQTSKSHKAKAKRK
ncbi:hypothetical protein EGW08_003239 [Elysia chlorotica]|uniref:Androgen-dependent TFPI-regulating protein n=1 Tax=Elysia chlorotica TaxID=188477 RepID=A0A433U586_ELYCH|nr:hypothetical protein EGW08_003239 [Elysia chlorotica]